jgi:hypothetical protein
MVDYEYGLLFALGAALVHWTFHEASHVLMSKAIGPSSVALFRPWPHIWKEWFYLGRMEMIHTEHFNSLEKAYFYAAPLIMCSMLLFVYSLLGGWFLLAAIMPLIDVLFWVFCAITKPPHNDGSLCMEAWKGKDRECSKDGSTAS